MITLKCKMCGGELTITDDTSVCECEYCGSKQTIPTVDDEKIMKLYDRANRLRMANEFDKAAGVYESIIEESDSEAEAYWGLLLCKYGIEYVDDPATGDKIPTCHRVSFDGVMDDEDFDLVMENSDALSRSVYREQAKQIEEIRKGIVEVSGKEPPYDIFICYKETSDDGDRTVDSVIAQDVYDALTEKGYRVFFSRISLEDKLGTEYEPYIFAALNSAKIMLAFGSSYDYYNAVWVKNEWSRYLKLMAKDKDKHLIPCYKDIDAYDMPKEFKHLQAQDMGKIGAIQDLVRGIDKILDKKVVVQKSTGDSSVTALIQRGNMALEDQEWNKADEFFEEVLNTAPQCAEAYIGKLMVKCKVCNIEALTDYYISEYETAKFEKIEACPENVSHIDDMVSKYMVLDFLSDLEIRRQYKYDRGFLSELSFRKQQKLNQISEIESEKLLVRARQYASGDIKMAIDKMMKEIDYTLDKRITDAQSSDNDSIDAIKRKYNEFLSETDIKVQDLYNKALEKQESRYNIRVDIMKNAHSIAEFENLQTLFASMHGYKDTNDLVKKCQLEIDRLKDKKRSVARKEAEQEAELLRKKEKRHGIIIVSVIACAICISACLIVALKLRYYKNIDLMKTASIGDTVSFGNTDWLVIDKQNEKVLVISKHVICQKEYDEDRNIMFKSVNQNTTWEDCTLRSWLNGEYLASAFSSREQGLIITTTNKNNGNSYYGLYGGADTEDKVFLLSIEEVEQYFTTNKQRYAAVDGSSDGAWWWLRSPGSLSSNAAYVSSTGTVIEAGNGVSNADGAVRPAMWLDISD